MRKFTDIAQSILGTVCVLYYIFIRIFYGDIVSLWIWPVLGCALIIKSTVCILVRGYARKKALNAAGILSGIYNAVFVIFLISLLCFLVFAFCGMTEKHDSEELGDCDACIILGAAVYGERPSPVLSKRIAAAYTLLTENKAAIAVCTGGTGSRASISEAECIKRELVKKGISEERLILEDNSTTTVENMKFALSKLPCEINCLAVITSGFHISRAKLILSNFTSSRIIGIPASGAGVLLPHYLLREYIVFAVDVLCGRYSVFI